MKKIYSLIIGMLMAVMLISGCGKQEESASPESEETEMTDAAQDEQEDTSSDGSGLFGTFYAQTLYGEDVTEEIFSQADLTMVNIWGTFCNPCIEEMPALGELSREYADYGFQIVGLISDVTEPEDRLSIQIVEETKADYTHMVASLDFQNGILRYVQGVPTTVFIDSEGNMVGEVYVGARDKEAWSQIIGELLKEVS